MRENRARAMSAGQQQFETLLRNMMSETYKTRKQAESAFSKTRKSQPSQVMQALLQVGRTSQESDMRQFALVTLRASLIDGETKLWSKLNAQTKALIQRELLVGIEQEADPAVRTNLREAAFDVASDLFEGAN